MTLAPPHCDFHLRDLLPHVESEAVFFNHIQHWVMVGPPREKKEDGWSFRTGSVQTVQDPETGNMVVLEADYEVRLLKKRQTGAFQDTVLVGRSTTSDVIVPDASISKLHIRVRFSPPTLADANSSNGTTYNNQKLQPDEVLPLLDGSTVILGERYFYLFSPEKLRTLLQKSRLQVF